MLCDGSCERGLFLSEVLEKLLQDIPAEFLLDAMMNVDLVIQSRVLMDGK